MRTPSQHEREVQCHASPQSHQSQPKVGSELDGHAVPASVTVPEDKAQATKDPSHVREGVAIRNV